jgi:hypothetical protein
MLSPKCSQPLASKFVAFTRGSAIHCARDSALRCSGGHIERRSAGNSSRNRISAILACFKAAFLRSDRRRVRRAGAGLAELRVPCLDTRRCALADRARGLRGRAVWFLFCNAISSRTQNALTYVRDEITCERTQRASRTLHHSFRASAGTRLHGRKSARRGSRGCTRLSRRISVYTRDLSFDVSRPAMDHAAICRIRLGGGIQPALPVLAQQRAERPFGRV